jgi:hypothetical protein
VLSVDLRRETDIEQLRRVALAQPVQIEQLLRVLSAQAAELGALKGNETELQEKLALVEQLTRAIAAGRRADRGARRKEEAEEDAREIRQH